MEEEVEVRVVSLLCGWSFHQLSKLIILASALVLGERGCRVELEAGFAPQLGTLLVPLCCDGFYRKRWLLEA